MYLESRDIKVLEDFITLKERHIAQRQDVEENIEVILQTEWLISYLKGFPSKDRREAMQALFWPIENIIEEQGTIKVVGAATAVEEENILAQLPPAIVRGYFGPKSMRPRGHRICQQNTSRNRGNNSSRQDIQQQRTMVENEDINTYEGARNYASTSNVIAVSRENPFPTFDPQKDVFVEMFVAIETREDDQLKGMPFFIAKLINMEK